MGVDMWWIWMAMATILLVAEIFTAGFFLIWFSIGAAAAGILDMLGVGRPAQLIVFILASGILFVFGRRFAERVTVKQPPGIGADRFVEKNGVVVEEINNHTGKGRIIVDSDEWRALSESGETIVKDTIVKVVRIDGTKTVVKPLEKEE